MHPTYLLQLSELVKDCVPTSHDVLVSLDSNKVLCHCHLHHQYPHSHPHWSRHCQPYRLLKTEKGLKQKEADARRRFCCLPLPHNFSRPDASTNWNLTYSLTSEVSVSVCLFTILSWALLGHNFLNCQKSLNLTFAAGQVTFSVNKYDSWHVANGCCKRLFTCFR